MSHAPKWRTPSPLAILRAITRPVSYPGILVFTSIEIQEVTSCSLENDIDSVQSNFNFNVTN